MDNANNLPAEKIKYGGYEIHKFPDSHCALVYKNSTLQKCIAGDILGYLHDNAVEKAKTFIDQIKNKTV